MLPGVALSSDYVMTDHRPRLCATIMGDTPDAIRARALRCDADMIELRLDGAGRVDVAGLVADLPAPAIVTCRRSAEGGRFDGSEEERLRILSTAVRSDAAYVDLEWRSPAESLTDARAGRGIVLSHHEFAGMPRDLETRIAAMASTRAEIVKVAVAVGRLSDCLTLKDLAERYAGRNLLLIGMGDVGLVTRVLAARFGSPWTYAGEGVAPGQVSVERMRREFRFASIGADTTLNGLFGRPVVHSLSPAMHNAALAALGLDAVYLPLAGADADDCLRFAEAFRVAGASVTAPFKSDLIPRLLSIDDEAGRVGAVNTIRRTPDGWVGMTTDGEGFMAGLGDLPVAGVRAAVLGSGGAARSVSAALAARGAFVTLYGRDPNRVSASAARIGVRGAPRPVPAGSWDLLVNATPVGTWPDVEAQAFPEGVFDGRVAYDLVYNPSETPFLRAAAAAGCRTIGGLAMLVEQARRQVAWWTGRMPPAGVMYEAARWRLDAAA